MPHCTVGSAPGASCALSLVVRASTRRRLRCRGTTAPSHTAERERRALESPRLTALGAFDVDAEGQMYAARTDRAWDRRIAFALSLAHKDSPDVRVYAPSTLDEQVGLSVPPRRAAESVGPARPPACACVRACVRARAFVRSRLPASRCARALVLSWRLVLVRGFAGRATWSSRAAVLVCAIVL